MDPMHPSAATSGSNGTLFMQRPGVVAVVRSAPSSPPLSPSPSPASPWPLLADSESDGESESGSASGSASASASGSGSGSGSDERGSADNNNVHAGVLSLPPARLDNRTMRAVWKEICDGQSAISMETPLQSVGGRMTAGEFAIQHLLLRKSGTATRR